MVPVRQVIIYAKVFITGSESEDAEDSNDGPTHRYYTEAWNLISSLFPDVQEELWQLSIDEFQTRIQAIKSGISSVRSADANRLKTHTADYVPLDPNNKIVLNIGKSKMDRGFNHKALGRLLVPVNLLEEYNENRDRVINRIESGEYRVTALQFPALLYQEGSYDPDNLLNGLFRGHFLIRCCISIFVGPQNALKAPGQVVVSKSCVANRLNVTRITPEIIAYICVQARFTLTTAGCWGYRDGGFNYSVFRRKIIELFQPGNGCYDDVWATTTLKWWNKQVFGNKDGNPTLLSSPDSDGDDDDNFFARVEAQVVMRMGGMATGLEPTRFENHAEDTPSTPLLTRVEPVPSSSVASAIASSPITPQPEEEIDCDSNFGRTCNLGTNVSDNIYYSIVSTTAILRMTSSLNKKSVAAANRARLKKPDVVNWLVVGGQA
ncbi:hypothetical protein BGY98DRAFT_1068061 [Russula aff. rugulosa BPL654]|nr:hypothetical protein BGY98DRAFT_1068061 [Russula aff. rugulosa BPL654]